MLVMTEVLWGVITKGKYSVLRTQSMVTYIFPKAHVPGRLQFCLSELTIKCSLERNTISVNAVPCGKNFNFWEWNFSRMGHDE